MRMGETVFPTRDKSVKIEEDVRGFLTEEIDWSVDQRAQRRRREGEDVETNHQDETENEIASLQRRIMTRVRGFLQGADVRGRHRGVAHRDHRHM